MTTIATPPAAREPRDVSRIVAANLIKALDPSGLSLVELAAAAHLEPRDLAAALGGQRELTLAELGILAHVLGVGITTLFTEEAQ